MKPVALLLGVATLAVYAAVIGLSIYSQAPLLALFLDAGLIIKLSLFLMMPLFLLAVVLPGREGKLLTIVMTLALALGLLASLYGIANTLNAIAITGTSNPKIYGPSLSQGLMPIAFGLLIATAAMLHPRPKPQVLTK